MNCVGAVPGERKIMVYAIDDTIEFTTPEGRTLSGVVTGRNWCFDRLESYIVRAAGASYNVNAATLQSGYSF